MVSRIRVAMCSHRLRRQLALLFYVSFFWIYTFLNLQHTFINK